MPSHGRLTLSSPDTRTTVELMSHVITEKGKRNASHEIFSGSTSGESNVCCNTSSYVADECFWFLLPVRKVPLSNPEMG